MRWGGGGYLSYIAGIEGGFTIAFGAVIENAYGGGGRDAITGNGAANRLRGNGANDVIVAGGGNDTLEGGAGNDRMSGGGGADLLVGGAGRNRLTGGAAADEFVFTALVSAAQADHITDFVEGLDRIRLSAIDAVTGGADNAFAFIGASVFGQVAGQLRFQQVVGQDLTRVEGDVTGDGAADFTLILDGLHTLAAGDFFR